jgi:uncharacterized membrane protein YfcA
MENEFLIAKDLFPLSGVDIIATIIIFILASLTNAAGIGGGSIFSPVLLILLQLPIHYVIPISQFMIFGGCLMVFFIKAWHKHPNANKALIDYRMAMHL